MGCRINRRTEWYTKLMLEWQTWKEGCFTTLTYNPEELPEKEYFTGGSLIKKDIQDFMKRFRKYYEEQYGYRKVRYFAVGEYGEKSKRAHYHILLFNVDSVYAEKIIQKAWKKGHSQTDLLHENRIKYAVKYTIKKETSLKDFPDGREPEFSMMSRKPGLGWYAIPKIAKALKKRGYMATDQSTIIHKKTMELEGIKDDNTWNGNYMQNGKWFMLDANMKDKLNKYMLPLQEEYVEARTPTFLTREYKARQERLKDNSFFDTMKFVKSKELEDAKKKENKELYKKKHARYKI